MEEAEILLLAGVEQGRQVGLVVAAGAGPGPVVVETPDPAVGQDAPAYAALRLDLGHREISQYLAVWGPAFQSLLPVPGVERKTEALALLHHRGVTETVLGPAFLNGPLLGVGVGEKEVIGDIFLASRSLLGQVVGPSQPFQDRTDQVRLGLGFVRVRRRAEGVVGSGDTLPEGGKRLGLGE